jgi:hypothetical protein
MQPTCQNTVGSHQGQDFSDSSIGQGNEFLSGSRSKGTTNSSKGCRFFAMGIRILTTPNLIGPILATDRAVNRASSAVIVFG